MLINELIGNIIKLVLLRKRGRKKEKRENNTVKK